MGELMWCRNRAPKNTVTLLPMFFYHVPKTGGMALFNAWRGAQEVIGNIYVNKLGGSPAKLPLIFRMDEPHYPRAAFERTYSLIAAHQPFGFHLRFKQKFLLATMLRDPVRRVVSEYTYDCMRAAQPPSEEGLRSFFSDPANQNVTTKMLSGLRHNRLPNDGDVKNAIANLRNHFWMYGTTSDMKRLCEAYLTASDLCNVLSGRINETLPEYRIDVTPFVDEIAALNPLDLALYRFVQETPHYPEVPDGNDAHPLTILQREVGDASGSMAIRKVVVTSAVRVIAETQDVAGFHRLFDGD